LIEIGTERFAVAAHLFWSAKMKTMTVSLLFVAVLASILFLSVWYLTANADAAKSAAAFAVAALPSVSAWLEQSEAKQSSIPGKKMAIRSFEGFSMSLPVAVAVGTIVGVAILNIANFFAGFVAGMISSTVATASATSAIMRISILGSFPVTLLGFYLLGKWLSWRCSRNGIVAVVLVALLTAIANRLLELSVPGDAWQSIYQEERTALSLSVLALSQFAFLLVLCLLGFWRGRRERMSRYVGYLLSALPAETQDSLVDLAFEEAKKIVADRRSSPQHSV
jgi:hypothetical protein